jgi:parallel beta-helix repeat protein
MKIIKALFIVLGVFFGISISAMAAGPVVNVPPPIGGGGDDTANIQGALDDCMNNHSAGCTIQLSAGTYKSQQLFIEDFHGTLKGRGMDATILQVLPFQEVTPGSVNIGSLDVNPPSRTNKYPVLLIFAAGDIKVSDMTFKVIDHDPVAASWCYENQYGQTWLFGLLGVIGTSANLLIERVGFDGGPGTLTSSGHNYNAGPIFMGLSSNQPLTGTFKVVSSLIRNSEDDLLVLTVRDAQITIGGSPSEGNLVENGSQGAAIVPLGNSHIEISYNNLEPNANPWSGVLVYQDGWWIPQEPSQFIIKHNTIKVTGAWVRGIWAGDFGPPNGLGKSADFVICDNTIQIAGSGTDPALAGLAGIDALYADGAVISNNRILGNSTVGIALEGASQCMVKANNVEKLNADWVPIALLTADYPTHDSTVVGSGKKTNVYDEGINNTLVGVNNMQGNPPGPAIRDTMKRKIEMIKSIRRP